MDKTEQVNVNEIDFGEAAKQKKMETETFETARCPSHDSMEETIPWSLPKVIEMAVSLVHWGSSSREKFTQAEREELILQEIFLSKDSVPDSPHEPDPECYEHIPPKLIPLDEESSMDVAAFQDATYQGSASVSTDGASRLKMQPATANMDCVGAAKGQSISSSVKASNPLNVQEFLTLIMQGAQGNPKPEELLKQLESSDYIKRLLECLLKQPKLSDYVKQLLGSLQNQPPILPEGRQFDPGFCVQKQPDFSNYIKQLLGNIQSQPPILPEGRLFKTGFCVQKQPDLSDYMKHLLGSIQRQPHITPEAGVGLRAPTLLPNEFPSVPHFPPVGLMPPSQGPMPIDPGVLVGPIGRMGPGCPAGAGGSPSSGRGSHESGHRGHNRNRDRSPQQGYDLDDDGSYDGGHNQGCDGEHGHGRGRRKSHGDMSTRSMCRHFMSKGNCRYEHNCAFYHPGVNGPPLYRDSDVSTRSRSQHFRRQGNRRSKQSCAFDHHHVNEPPLLRNTGLNEPPSPRDTDMSTRSVCWHFTKKGNCRYEHNCSFYHPGVNGPPQMENKAETPSSL